MKACWTNKTLALGLLLGLATITMTGCGLAAQPPEAEQSGAPPFSEVEVGKGVPIYVRLQQSISSVSAEPGQKFVAVLDEALVVNGQTLLTKGGIVDGRVVAVRKTGRLHEAGYVRLTLSALIVNGKDVPIETSSVFVEGGNYKNRNLAYMGGLKSGSLLDMLSASHESSSFTTSIAGASGNPSAAYVSGKQDVGFLPDRRIEFRLMQPVTIEISGS